MSTPNPRPRPRRRIAGERRPLRADEQQPAHQPAQQPAQQLAEEPSQRTGGTQVLVEPEARTVEDHLSPDRPARPARRAPSWRTVAVLGVVAVLLVAVAAVLGLRVWSLSEVRQQDRVADTIRTAPPVAERAAATILAYRSTTLDADVKAAERFLTPSYRKEYAKTMALLRPSAVRLRARVEADVRASAVMHADPDRATVLLYVNQTTTSTANGGQPQQALNRVQLTMVRSGDGWLVSKITSY